MSDFIVNLYKSYLAKCATKLFCTGLYWKHLQLIDGDSEMTSEFSPSSLPIL